MSGPKRYAVQVFDDHLKDVFHLQARIGVLWELLRSKEIRDDTGRKIYSDEQWLDANHAQYEKLQGLVLKTGREDLTQKEFDAFYNRIFLAIEKLAQFRDSLEKRIDEFADVEKNLDRHHQLAQEAARLAAEFGRMKSRFVSYHKKNSGNNIFEEIREKLDEVSFAPVIPAFTPGESVGFEELSEALKSEFEQSMKKMNALAAGIATEAGTTVKISLIENLPANDEDQIMELRAEIAGCVSEIRDGNVRKNLDRKLHHLSTSKKEAYFYSELLAETQQVLSHEDLCGEISDIRRQIGKLEPEEGAKSFAKELMDKADKLLNRKRLKPAMAEQLRNQLKELVRLNLDLRSERLAAESEQGFIRARLIAELRVMNYEVLTDMEVIDLEDQNDLMFAIPGQENFMNLRLDENGRMRYNFLIPENRHELTHEKTQQRLSEMEQNCEAFKNMLEKLSMQGLEIEPEHMLPVAERHLIKVPAKHAQLLQSRQNKENTRHEAKRKYRSR